MSQPSLETLRPGTGTLLGAEVGELGGPSGVAGGARVGARKPIVLDSTMKIDHVNFMLKLRVIFCRSYMYVPNELMN